MPQEFDNCVKNGGRVRTKGLGGGKYMHICFLNGKSYAGYVKTAKASNSANSMTKKVKSKYKVLGRE